ncbi:hypothetical protein F3Y22_tig00003194pilonHSYRG00006 [Hibiscus syriacus]|uniref:Uncharacterized protein n=1 Tax=Hibiscus syriacus TaxID=106335 RepID=A0A6A3CM49_HIBSY|nr:hypothetical protein F3Y22_tig00003194pilonHSYRG00006 [Hibiscus syriacus]
MNSTADGAFMPLTPCGKLFAPLLYILRCGGYTSRGTTILTPYEGFGKRKLGIWSCLVPHAPAPAPAPAPTEGNRLHSEGSQGHVNNEQGAPKEDIKKDHDSIDGNALIPFANHTGEPSQTKEGNEDFSRARPKKVPSTKDRNSTARTELEDSVEDSSQGTNSCTLPSPRTEHISLLNIDEPKRWMRRRKVNKWTYEEENALAEGVRKYGYQWTRILETYQEISRERTAVDLKDKWRNLQRK